MRTIKFKFLLLIFITIGSYSCLKPKDEKPVSCDGIHWTHNNENNQNEWKDLCSGFNACGGQTQSPIDIVNSVENNTLDTLVFDYHSTPTEIENNGHTIEFVCEEGSKLKIGNKVYDLLQFHYHALSEHTVAGNHYALEVHFVHKASDTDYAVVGIFFEEGDENPLFAEFLSHFPTEEGVYNGTTEIELTELLPEDKSFYHYGGSLTTPPCSEIVSWYLLQKPLTASASQITQFSAILNNNYRNVQNLNGRTIYKYNH